MGDRLPGQGLGAVEGADYPGSAGDGFLCGTDSAGNFGRVRQRRRACRRRAGTMIRELQLRDLEQVMRIWLEGNLDAHSFIPRGYWESKVPMVREQLLQAEVCVYGQAGEVLGFAGMQGDYLAGIFVDAEHRSRGDRQIAAEPCAEASPHRFPACVSAERSRCAFLPQSGFFGRLGKRGRGYRSSGVHDGLERAWQKGEGGMASHQEFVDYVAEQLQDAGRIRTKRMFGEYGLYCDDVFFAVICDDQLFVKATPQGEPRRSRSCPRRRRMKGRSMRFWWRMWISGRRLRGWYG